LIGNEQVRFQNNIQTLFSRVRLLYGATPLEDIINYNTVIRALTEWSSTNQNGIMDQTSIAEGIGGTTIGLSGTTANTFGQVNVRQNYIQGIDYAVTTTPVDFLSGNGVGIVPNNYLAQGVTNQTNSATVGNVNNRYCTRRYQINFGLGLFTQDKLIPTKFMASQLAIEVTLAEDAVAILAYPGIAQELPYPTYSITNLNLIPEVLEFDAKYDEMFLAGLREGGVVSLISLTLANQIFIMAYIHFQYKFIIKLESINC
jgi:hypothetical protein